MKHMIHKAIFILISIFKKAICDIFRRLSPKTIFCVISIPPNKFQIFKLYSPALSNNCPILETNRSNATSFFPLLITISARALVGSTYI